LKGSKNPWHGTKTLPSTNSAAYVNPCLTFRYATCHCIFDSKPRGSNSRLPFAQRF